MFLPTGSLLIPLIVSLSLDTFAVSAAVGIAPLSSSLRLRFAASCALAEAGMPLIGFVAGGVVGRFSGLADWLSVLLLLGAGLWIIHEACEEEDELAEALEQIQNGGRGLLFVALSVSIDELAVGMALGTLHLPVVPVVSALAVQALVVSLIGLRVGAAFGARIGARAPFLAGILLCLVGVSVAIGNLAG